jgi:hypothetical protein
LTTMTGKSPMGYPKTSTTRPAMSIVP